MINSYLLDGITGDHLRDCSPYGDDYKPPDVENLFNKL